MHVRTRRTLLVFLSAALMAPTLADDCATVKSAILYSGQTPKSLVTTKTDGQGKKVVTRQVQTADNKYVQTPDGKWFAMNIAIKDLDKDMGGLLTCRRGGSDSVNGESTTVYEVHLNLDGQPMDKKIWVTPRNLIVKTEGVLGGANYITEYDFAHVAAPANAISMGGK